LFLPKTNLSVVYENNVTEAETFRGPGKKAAAA
jgi:hypothetical protein